MIPSRGPTWSVEVDVEFSFDARGPCCDNNEERSFFRIDLHLHRFLPFCKGEGRTCVVVNVHNLPVFGLLDDAKIANYPISLLLSLVRLFVP